MRQRISDSLEKISEAIWRIIPVTKQRMAQVVAVLTLVVFVGAYVALVGTDKVDNGVTSETTAILEPTAVPASTSVVVDDDPAEIPNPENWLIADDMNTGRQMHQAVALKDGRVLVFGGFNSIGAPETSAEIFDPAAGTWKTTGELAFPREFSAASTLMEDGRVMVVGGGPGPSIADVEIFNPVEENWTIVASLNVPRFRPLIESLEDGRVLVAGGYSCPSPPVGSRTLTMNCHVDSTEPQIEASSEIYDPATNTWTMIGAMADRRASLGSTDRLHDGRVIRAGGGARQPRVDIEIFDPATESWSLLPDMSEARGAPSVVVMDDSSVLIAGGLGPGFFPEGAKEVERFNPIDQTWSDATPVNGNRCGAKAFNYPGDDRIVVSLPDVVTLCGSSFPVSYSLEIYDPGLDEWTEYPVPNAMLSSVTVMLNDGRIVVTGGKNEFNEAVGTTVVFDLPAK